MSLESALKFDPNTKSFGILPDFDSWGPFYITTDNPNQSVTLPAGTLSPSYPMSFKYSGPFIGHYLQYSIDNDTVLVSFVDGRDGYRYVLGGKYVHLNTVASQSPGRPAILPEILTLQRQTSINVSFRNVGGAQSVVRLAVFGYNYETSRINTVETREKVKAVLNRMRYIRPFFSPLDDEFVTIPANTTRNYDITLDDGGFFEVFKINGHVTGGNKSDLLFRIIDSTSKPWSGGNTPEIRGDMLLGTGEYPNILPSRLMIQPKNKITFEVRNTSAGNITLYLTLIGRRIFMQG